MECLAPFAARADSQLLLPANVPYPHFRGVTDLSSSNKQDCFSPAPTPPFHMFRCPGFLFPVTFALTALFLTAPLASAFTVLGAGTGALLDGDLTDPENNGSDVTGTGFNWVSITASSENAWTAEGAYNVFDNKVGAGDDKWCCDGPPQWIAVQFDRPYVLTHFTIAAGNDAPERDPTRWYIEGSNDGTNWTIIYGWTAGISPFGPRLEVLRFDGNGADFATPPSFRWFRYRVQTNDNALLQVNELEFFGIPVQAIRNFGASHTLIPPGEPLTFSWEVDPATTDIAISGIGNVTAQTVNGIGSAALNPGPAITTAYTMTATHPLTTAQQSVTVAVTNQPIIRSFSATPAIIGPGDSATLNWNVANNSSLQLDGTPVSGTSRVVTPPATATYVLTAANANGSTTSEATVSVVVPGVPVISEFMADNDGAVIVDSDGDKSDWIEIHNPSGTVALLQGYFLTDDPADLQKWAFPAVSLAPGGYRVVFASGKNRTGAEWHTNFSLDANGEYLALVKPDGVTVVSEFGPGGTNYPDQNEGVSFGTLTNPPQPGYFATATPGAANGAGFTGYVKDTKFSVNRGFFTTPQALTITSGTPGASIRYTTNGSWPSETAGTLYTGPITVDRTMPVRAIAYMPGHRSTDVDTHTYIFVNDVVNQTAATTQSTYGLPATWGAQAPDYGMDSRVTSLHNATIRDDLKTVPTFSIVCDANDFFGSGGIYSNPNNSGEAWERGISLEIIDPANPDGSKDFQLNCGIRIQGGAFRNFSLTLKKSFRVLFKGQYGPTKLRYPLFGSEAAKEFDSIILRMESNDGYQWGNMTNVQYARDEFGRRSALDLGIPTGRGRFVHLYINGVYWGVFNPVERPDAGFAASYFGVDKDEWDGINFGTAINEGSTVPWNTMLGLVDDITAAPTESGKTAALMKAEGLNPDGSKNPLWADYINVDNFIDYLLVNWYTGNADWPHRNWYTGRERDILDPAPLKGSRTSTGSHFFMWDCETSLLLGAANDKTGDYSGVCAPYQHLRNSLEFRVRFGDRAHRALFNGGALTPQPCLDRYAEITKDHRSILIPELARWGDQHGSLRTIGHWQAEYNNVRNNWLSVRTPGLVSVLRGAGLYPLTDAPVFSQHGGSVLPATPVTLSTNADKIYYTTDGSDPRLLGGGVKPGAQLVDFGASGPLPVTFMNTGHIWKYLDNGSNQGTAWRATAFDDTSWAFGPSSLGYGTEGEGAGTTVGFGGNTAARYATTYFRTTVTIPDPTAFVNFLLRIKYDDAAAVYINGAEVIRTSNLPAAAAYDYYTSTGVTDETSWKDYTLPVTRFIAGVNTIAVEIHQASATSSDIRLDLLLRGQTSVTGGNVSDPIFFNQPTLLTARSFDSGAGEWSALNKAFFSIDTVPASAANLVVSEFCYRPLEPSTPAEQAVSTNRDEFEFIELMNIGAQTIDLTGVSFTAGINFDIPDNTLLLAGGRIVVAKNIAAFSQRYGGSIAVAGAFAAGNLGNDGERVVLASSRTGTIREFTYDDNDPWPAAADGDGFSLVLIAPVTNPDHNVAANWRSSAAVNGNPGTTDAGTYAAWKLANSISDDHGDPDRDGLTNFGEFAMGTSHNSPSTDALPTARLLDVDGIAYRAIDIRRSLAAADEAELIIETSGDLTTWTADAVYAGEINNSDGTATVTWRTAQPFSTTPRRYIRARFVLR
jgi:CotH kinase protein/Fn3 associated/Lamin Tail Domain/F5/8 type C domain/Chitobiase/beta-hexosaminidase C-terminal domain